MVGCDVPVQDEMPIETWLREVEQRVSDENVLPNLDFDDRMLGSVA